MKIFEFIELYNFSQSINKSEGEDFDIQINIVKFFNPKLTHKQLLDLSMDEFSKLYKKSIINLNYQPKVKKKDRLFYIFKKVDFSKLKVSDFVDLEYFINESFIDNIHYICATIYKNKFIKDKEKIAQYFLKWVDIEDIYLTVQEFTEFRIKFLKSYENLFSTTDNIPDEYIDEVREENKSNLIYSVYSLSNNDITKVNEILDLNIYEFFNYLSWVNEENRKLNKINQ